MRVLRDVVDCIACEDTRQTQKLLTHFDIRKPLLSYHEHNEAARAAEIVARIERGESVALVSDAGTPLISDPGYRLVRAALDCGLPIVPLPGASAFVTALAASGLPTDQVRFIGFLPAKSGARRRTLQSLESETATVAAYESPHRILECLGDICDVLPERPLVIARELTKIHEEFLRGTAAAILEQLKARGSIKGEWTLLIGRAIAHKPPDAASNKREIQRTWPRPASLLCASSSKDSKQLSNPLTEVAALEASGLSRMDAIKSAAKKLGLPKREVYRLLTEGAAEAGNSLPDKRRD